MREAWWTRISVCYFANVGIWSLAANPVGTCCWKSFDFSVVRVRSWKGFDFLVSWFKSGCPHLGGGGVVRPAIICAVFQNYFAKAMGVYFFQRSKGYLSLYAKFLTLFAISTLFLKRKCMALCFTPVKLLCCPSLEYFSSQYKTLFFSFSSDNRLSCSFLS